MIPRENGRLPDARVGTSPTPAIPIGLCQCGCGRETSISDMTHRQKGYVRGVPRRYIHGHNPASETPGYTVADDGCWNFNGYIDKSGRAGAIHMDGKYQRSYRAYYERMHGPVPHGLQLDHLCRNRRCINPDHLEPVTAAENTRRGVACKLNRDDVAVIRLAAISGRKQIDLAREYGVSKDHINRIVRGKAWK